MAEALMVASTNAALAEAVTDMYEKLIFTGTNAAALTRLSPFGRYTHGHGAARWMLLDLTDILHSSMSALCAVLDQTEWK